MATIVMNTDKCDIAHEAHMLEEYGNEVTSAEITQAGESPVVQGDQQANAPEPAADPDIALLSAPEEDEPDDTGLLRSAFLPHCP